jgi:hypothetical protein
MTPGLHEIASSFLIGIGTYLLLRAFFSLAELFSCGYAPRYLRFEWTPQIRCPRAFAKLIVWGTDACAMLLAFAVLTVYDCGILGGVMRLPHLASLLVGFVLAFVIYRRLLKRILSRIFSMALELLLLPIGVTLYPFRILFSAILKLCCRLVLLCRRKCAKMRENKAIKRYTESQVDLASAAFLPNDVREGRYRVA